jgi:hypothetical protein
MRPQSPVVPGADPANETIIAETQEEYGNLPALINHVEGVIMTRWAPSEEEKAFIAEHGYFYLWQWTFGGPVQPLAIEARWIDPESVVQVNPNTKAEKPGLSREDVLAFLNERIATSPSMEECETCGQPDPNRIVPPASGAPDKIEETTKSVSLGIPSSGDPAKDMADLERFAKNSEAIDRGVCPNHEETPLATQPDGVRFCRVCGFTYSKVQINAGGAL